MSCAGVPARDTALNNFKICDKLVARTTVTNNLFANEATIERLRIGTDLILDTPAVTPQSISSFNSSGQSRSAARADHTHEGVHSLSLASVTSQRVGDIVLQAGPGIALSEPTTNTFQITNTSLSNNNLQTIFTSGEPITAGSLVSFNNNSVYQGFSSPPMQQFNNVQLSDNHRSILLDDSVQPELFIVAGIEAPNDRNIQTGFSMLIQYDAISGVFTFGTGTSTSGSKARLPTANTGTTNIPFRVSDPIALAKIDSRTFAIGYVDMSGSGTGSVANQPRVIIGRVNPAGTSISYNAITLGVTTGNGNLEGSTNSVVNQDKQIHLRLIDIVGNTVRLLALWRNNTTAQLRAAVVTVADITVPTVPTVGAVVGTSVSSNNTMGVVALETLVQGSTYLALYTDNSLPFTWRAAIATITGATTVSLGAGQTVISGGSAQLGNNESPFQIATAQVSNNRIIVSYTDDFHNDQNGFFVMDIIGGVPTIINRNQAGMAASIYYWYPGATPAEVAYRLLVLSPTRYVMFWAEASNGTIGRSTVIDFDTVTATLTFGPFQTYSLQATQGITALVDSSNRFFVFFRSVFDTTGYVSVADGLTANQLNFNQVKGLRACGIAQNSAIAAGQPVTVVLFGISSVHFNLVPLQDYYGHGDGQLTLLGESQTPLYAVFKVGTALDSSTVLLNRTAMQ